jgi:antitoxin ParD1/3/4
MPHRMKRTFSLPAKDASYIDALVAAGAYESPNDVVEAGLDALRERNSAVEHWLRDKVVPVYDAMHSDPGRAVPAAEIATSIGARHADRVKRPKRGI